MKILKILGIAAALHALALLLIFANPGCSASKAGPEASPITAAPAPESGGQSPVSIAPAPEPATIRYSPTRPGTAVASALATQPVADVTPATTYTVARGDSVWSVAKKNQLPQADLEAANNLKATSVLHVGQKLIIPSRPSRPGSAVAAPAPEAAPAEQAPADKTVGDSTRHTVRPGETLGGIARKYGVKQGDIAVANNITDPRKIHPGQELVIPSKSSSPASKQSKGSKARAQPSEASAAPATQAPGSEQDLDAGLKAPSPTDVPVIKIDEPAGGQQPKSP